MRQRRQFFRLVTNPARTYDSRSFATVTHHVDISWNQTFTGGKQTRFVALEGDRLILSTPQSHDPIDGKLSVRRMTWRRV